MPNRPLREISRAVAISRSPSLPGLMKEMLHCAATARSLWLLQAKAKAESASVKIKPPWAMRWPLTICGWIVIVRVARPGLTSTIAMPSPLLASSSRHIASAQARATSSGDGVALIFTTISLRSRLLHLSPCGRGRIASRDAIRVRGCDLSLGRNPSPQPSPTRGEGARCRYLCASIQSHHALNVVVIHRNLVGHRPRLAGQNKAGLELPWLQRIIHLHARIAFDKLGATGRAHAALAGERQIHPCPQRRIKDRFLRGDRYLATLAVDDQRRRRFRRRASRHDRFRARLAAEPRDETLDMNTVPFNADIAAGCLDILAHAGGAADEDVIDAGRRHQRAQQHPHLLAIEPAVQDRDILLLAGDHMEYREPLHEAVLEFFQGLTKQHAGGRSVAIKQKEPAAGLARQHAPHDRKNRRDAGASGKTDIEPRLAGRRRDAEAAGRRHDVEFIAGLQFVGGPA